MTPKVGKDKKKRKNKTNKEFARITYGFVGVFLVLMGYIIYFTAFESQDIIDSPYNLRQDAFAENVVRGTIVDSQNNVLAETVQHDDGTETRSYPYGDLFAHVVGYDTNGKSGLELSENFNLLTSNAFFMEQIYNELMDEKNIGNTLITTLDANLQSVAYNALGDYDGSVVVMEPSTGKILSMVSKPSFDPNSVEENWETLSTDSDSVLLNRATQGVYVPGSVFKILTTLEYMRENPAYDSYSYTCTGSITKDGTTIPCFEGRVHGTQSLEQAFANSCNAAFADIGLSLDSEKYASTTKDLFFNKELPAPLDSVKSSFVLTEDSSSAEVMMTAIGQGNTLTNPYHMALIGSAIANGGRLMEPYLVDSITSYTGSEVEKTNPKSHQNLMTSEEAATLSRYMQSVVSNGTATNLNNGVYSVAGKTGTAEYSDNKDESHSWFLGFTNVENPDIVVSVIVEKSDGGLKASSVAKEVMDAYYNQ